MTIIENGEVFGCELMRNFSPLLASSVRKNSIAQIWSESETFNQLRNMSKIDLLGACSGCQLPCGSGCWASAANITHKMNGSDENCHMAR